VFYLPRQVVRGGLPDSSYLSAITIHRCADVLGDVMPDHCALPQGSLAESLAARPLFYGFMLSLIKDRGFESDGNHSSARLMILTLGLARSLDQTLYESFRVVEGTHSEDVVRRLAEEEVAVLVLGPRLTANEALSILGRHSANSPGTLASVVLLCAGPEPELFQPFVNDGHVFYMARAEITAGQLRSIIVCAATRFRSRMQDNLDPWAAPAAKSDLLFDFCVRLPMQNNLPNVAALLIETARGLISAEAVQYFSYDPEDDTLTPADAVSHKGWSESAAYGLAAFAVRTAEPIRLECAGLDPRYDAEMDSLGNSDDVRFLAAPVIGPKGPPIGVITAIRNGQSKAFSEQDAHNLDLLAECAAPTLSQILLQNRIQALLIKRSAVAGPNSDVFREEALEYHVRSWDQQGEVLKTLPPWLRTVYWLMLGLVFAGLLALVAVPELRKILGKAS